jgi:hypothetical protein
VANVEFDAFGVCQFLVVICKAQSVFLHNHYRSFASQVKTYTKPCQPQDGAQHSPPNLCQTD